jgi:hypothetical protein
MAASTDATRVFWGTAWTADTLLARELRAAQAAEAADGVRRLFRKDALEIGQLVPAYARFVAGQVALLGREHPSVRTQYFSEEIDARDGLFSAERIAFMQGGHDWQEAPRPGETYAFLVDVGGEANGEGEAERQRHDSTALAAVAVERNEILEDALEAWRANPLARRIVALTSQYVVGGGLRIQCEHEATQRWLAEFWEHPLNQMPARIYEWCDELTRSGELFIALTSGADGMSYARAIPAVNITAVLTRENDVQQETGYIEALSGREGRGQGASEETERTWAGRSAYLERAADGSFQPILLHYAVNRPVGTLHGESDLAPLLRWLKRYAGWLEDRARLNRYRNSFLFVVKSKYASEAERLARQAALCAAPPRRVRSWWWTRAKAGTCSARS